MTITDKEFKRFINIKAGLSWCNCGCNARNELDYNILMTAVENIDKDDDIKFIVIKKEHYWCCEHISVDSKCRTFRFGKYGSMLLALQHALLYIMENER